MDIGPIRTDEDHRAALAEIEAYWGAPEGTEEGDKLDVLLALVNICETREFRPDRRAPLRHRRTRPLLGRVGGTLGIALTCLGSSRPSASAHGCRKIGEAWKNSGRPPCPTLQDRASRLSCCFPRRHRHRAASRAPGHGGVLWLVAHPTQFEPAASTFGDRTQERSYALSKDPAELALGRDGIAQGC